jgi:hypothetical protein
LTETLRSEQSDLARAVDRERADQLVARVAEQHEPARKCERLAVAAPDCVDAYREFDAS